MIQTELRNFSLIPCLTCQEALQITQVHIMTAITRKIKAQADLIEFVIFRFVTQRSIVLEKLDSASVRCTSEIDSDLTYNKNWREDLN